MNHRVANPSSLCLRLVTCICSTWSCLLFSPLVWTSGFTGHFECWRWTTLIGRRKSSKSTSVSKLSSLHLCFEIFVDDAFFPPCPYPLLGFFFIVCPTLLTLCLFSFNFFFCVFFLKRNLENNKKSRRSVDLLPNVKINRCLVSVFCKLFFLRIIHRSLSILFIFSSDTENVENCGRSWRSMDLFHKPESHHVPGESFLETFSLFEKLIILSPRFFLLFFCYRKHGKIEEADEAWTFWQTLKSTCAWWVFHVNFFFLESFAGIAPWPTERLFWSVHCPIDPLC